MPFGGRKVRFRARGFVVQRHPAASVVAFAVLIASWELAVRSGLIGELFLPAPSSVAIALWHLMADGTLWQNLRASLFRLGAGWLAGTLAGIVAGFAIGLSSVSRAAGVPVISAIYPIPKIALLPLFILWLGIGETSKVTVVALGVFFPTCIATFGAIDNVPRGAIRMAQSFDLPPWDILRKVVLPAALPGILSAFRITASTALLLLVAAEMIGAQFGIGAYVLQQGQLMQTDNLLAGVCVISVLGLAIGAALSWLERRLLTWR
ncbi:MAG: ABC transporter permease [Acetobacteraceae bacterium]|nr:ABC transporter permease [Acetobacteraceae bacterium]